MINKEVHVGRVGKPSKRGTLFAEVRPQVADGSDFSSFYMGGIYVASCSKVRVYPDRTPGGNRHHRSVDFVAVAGGAKGARSRQPNPMLEQLQADGSGAAQLPRHLQALSA